MKTNQFPHYKKNYMLYINKFPSASDYVFVHIFSDYPIQSVPLSQGAIHQLTLPDYDGLEVIYDVDENCFREDLDKNLLGNIAQAIKDLASQTIRENSQTKEYQNATFYLERFGES